MLGMVDRDARLSAFEARTTAFSINVLRLLDGQRWSAVMFRVVQQLSDAATSVASNHRAVRRSRSNREFAAKLQIVVEEIDESVHWLETIQTIGACRSPERLSELLTEARELRSMFAAARRTTRRLR
jgi:four helix bundle protein